MPLPDDARLEWPPRPHRKIHDQITAWDSWYASREPDGSQAAPTIRERLHQWVWGADLKADARRRQVRLPAASDVAQTSADLLFGEPVELRVSDTPQDAAQQRLEELADLIGLHNRLIEAAETQSAHGGVYLRPVWDTDIADHPLLTSVSAKRAVPDFTLGILRGVTFWEEVHRAGPAVWRHLERHEPGIILHGLYVGTDRQIGSRRPLAEMPQTAGFDDEVVLEGPLQDRLLPVYVPNMLPNRTHETPSGRSDFAGSEDLLRSLDDCWSSWMRDLRVGAARIIVDESLLDHTPGQPGRRFNADAEVFTPVRMSPTATDANKVTPIEFVLRVEEHAATADALFTRLVSAAGYSPESFGIHSAGPADSGRALKMREARTWRTRSRKQGYWTQPLTRLTETLLLMDAQIFGSGVTPDRPTVVWADGEADDPRETAETLELLYRARAMSTEMRVRLASPHLDGEELDAEVRRMQAEEGLAVEDPIQAGTVS